MAREGKDWVSIRRRTSKGQKGGGHVYIDDETLLYALRFAEIPENETLVCKRYPLKDSKGTAKIILKIRPREKIKELGELE